MARAWRGRASLFCRACGGAAESLRGAVGGGGAARGAAGGASVEAQIIETYDGEIVTGRLLQELPVAEGAVAASPHLDILKIAVVNRYEPAPPAVGFIRGFGLKRGAIASSVAHDSHNVVAVGATDEALAAAINLVIAARGGVLRGGWRGAPAAAAGDRGADVGAGGRARGGGLRGGGGVRARAGLDAAGSVHDALVHGAAGDSRFEDERPGAVLGEGVSVYVGVRGLNSSLLLVLVLFLLFGSRECRESRSKSTSKSLRGPCLGRCASACCRHEPRLRSVDRDVCLCVAHRGGVHVRLEKLGDACAQAAGLVVALCRGERGS